MPLDPTLSIRLNQLKYELKNLKDIKFKLMKDRGDLVLLQLMFDQYFKPNPDTGVIEPYNPDNPYVKNDPPWPDEDSDSDKETESEFADRMESKFNIEPGKFDDYFTRPDDPATPDVDESGYAEIRARIRENIAHVEGDIMIQIEGKEAEIEDLKVIQTNETPLAR